MTSQPIQVIFFDAVGTLLFPFPSVATIYARLAARFGSRLSAEQIADRFEPAFLRQEEVDLARGWRVSEARERSRWRTIVSDVLFDVVDEDACFHALWEHFARPEAWRVRPDAEATLQCLTAHGYTLGICSNFDARLHTILDACPALAPLQHRAVSSEVGWRKPAPEFYAHLCERTGVAPEQILVVGDDVRNDVEGPRQAGMWAMFAKSDEVLDFSQVGSSSEQIRLL